ncbi:hypothetical protein U27_05104 [Candidatus Vecturithrix granuli]|uniref:ABC transporter substrate binding protein n=1 Tax=Vecturithrix granuli TaxID=1499967 RepID=A0A081C0M6_VECG1|nr:hypothetical protein U27_05104 [Candidatus Vecturithrix granuli]
MKRMVTMSVLLVVLLGMFANLGFAADLKTLVVLDLPTNQTIQEQMLNGLTQAGLIDQQNVIIKRIAVPPKEGDPAPLIVQIQEIAPDVILALPGYGTLFAALNKLSIPVIARVNVESFVGADGMPTGNITGIYTNLPDLVYNSYKFLQKVAPLKPGQQVVFLDNPESTILPKETVIDALQRLQIPLKAIVNTAVYEDWQQAILQYNDDPDVGWILRSTPRHRRDGSAVNTVAEIYPWEREHLKKPTITQWEFSVQAGALCAFGIDTAEVGVQCGEMVARVLQGEDIRTIKAEYPRKVSIALNRKTATKLGIVFSLDVLNLANVIYDDYEGKQVIRKK